MVDEIQWLLDRARIIDVITGFANAFDTQDWDRLRLFLADDLWTDYSAFRGVPPSATTPEAYVASRREALSGLRTLHISTNHQVTITGDDATCFSAYRIYRFDPALAEDENRLDTAGNYEHGLVRAGASWRIHRIRQTVVFRTGNASIHRALKAPERKDGA
jgi:SnoaL-like domain